MLLGLGGTGKTTLIRKMLLDDNANPEERTGLIRDLSRGKHRKATRRFERCARIMTRPLLFLHIRLHGAEHRDISEIVH